MTNQQQADALLKRWNSALSILYSAHEQFEALVGDYDALGKEVSAEERDEFERRMIAMRALDVDALANLAADFQAVEFPLDVGWLEDGSTR